MEMSRKCRRRVKKASTLLRHDGATARNRRRDGKTGRSMPLGTLQDTGKALTRPCDHRVTQDGHGKRAKPAEEALWAQNGLSAEAPLPPKPLSMHLGHVPRRGNVYPDTLPSTAMHGAWPQGPKSGSKDGGFSTIKLVRTVGTHSVNLGRGRPRATFRWVSRSRHWGRGHEYQ